MQRNFFILSACNKSLICVFAYGFFVAFTLSHAEIDTFAASNFAFVPKATNASLNVNYTGNITADELVIYNYDLANAVSTSLSPPSFLKAPSLLRARSYA